MEHLELSSNSLSSLKTDDFSGLKSLSSLRLNDNKIKVIDNGTFEALSSLRVLNLQSNKITDESLAPDVFSGLSNLLQLHLQKNHILKKDSFRKAPFSHLKSLQWLSVLSQSPHKMKSFLPSNFLWNLTHLQLYKLYKLYLEETHLKTLDFLVQANLHHLYYLQVSKNQLASINHSIIQSLPGLRLLDMRGNTFTCDCSMAWFIKWVEEDDLTEVLAANTYECNSPPNLIETKLLKLDVQSCNSQDTAFFFYISSTLLVLLTLFTSLIYHFLHRQIVYAYYLFLAFLYDYKRQGSSKSCGFQYDAFVSYNAHDELWVTSELLPKLEGEQGWRICLHHRDFQPGKPIVDNIVDGIYGSRKTICVISQHYLESEWCSREVQVASFRLFDEKKDVLILVFLEDIPTYRLSPYYRMRSLVKKCTYLSWPKARQDPRVFWEKLRVALGARRGSEEENSLSDVQNVL